jgi:hypothetical protein
MGPERRRKALANGAMALLAALSVLAAVLFGGQRYFYCPLMEEASLRSCCADETRVSDSPEQGPALDRQACCITKHFASPAPSSVGASKLVIRSPLVTVLAASPMLAAPAHAPMDAKERRFARAGPERTSLRSHRLRLMVSLT